MYIANKQKKQGLPAFSFITVAKAATNPTKSTGVKLSPALPPIVPLKPEIDLTNDIFIFNLLN